MKTASSNSMEAPRNLGIEQFPGGCHYQPSGIILNMKAKRDTGKKDAGLKWLVRQCRRVEVRARLISEHRASGSDKALGNRLFKLLSGLADMPDTDAQDKIAAVVNAGREYLAWKKKDAALVADFDRSLAWLIEGWKIRGGAFRVAVGRKATLARGASKNKKGIKNESKN